MGFLVHFLSLFISSCLSDNLLHGFSLLSHSWVHMYLHSIDMIGHILPKAYHHWEWLIKVLLSTHFTNTQTNHSIGCLSGNTWERLKNFIREYFIIVGYCLSILRFGILQCKQENSCYCLVCFILKIKLVKYWDFIIASKNPLPFTWSIVYLAWFEIFILAGYHHLESLSNRCTHEISSKARKFICNHLRICFLFIFCFVIFGSDSFLSFLWQCFFNLYIKSKNTFKHHIIY